VSPARLARNTDRSSPGVADLIASSLFEQPFVGEQYSHFHFKRWVGRWSRFKK
jgi:hypothetical protein